MLDQTANVHPSIQTRVLLECTIWYRGCAYYGMVAVLKPVIIIVVDNICQVRMVAEHLALDYLENDILYVKALCPGRGHGGADTQLRLIYRVGEEVDIESAALVETVNVVLVDLLVNFSRRFIAYPVHRCFAGKYATGANIDDWLEDVTEIEVQTRMIYTIVALDLRDILQVRVISSCCSPSFHCNAIPDSEYYQLLQRPR